MTRVTVVPAVAERRRTLDQLYQMYLRGLWPGPDGRYPTGRLERFLHREGSQAWLVLCEGRTAGFAVARRHELGGSSTVDFFVVPAARGTGMAEDAARAVLALRPGRWHVAFQEENPRAARFWRRTVARVDPLAVEEVLPVPGRPDAPPDHWSRLTVRPGGPDAGPDADAGPGTGATTGATDAPA